MTSFPRAAAILAALALAAACSKSEPPPPPKPKAAAPAAAAPAPSTAGTASADEVDAALKERLARQEAATKLFDRKPEAPKPEPRVEAKAESKPAPPVEPPKAVLPPPKAEPPKPEPPKVAAASPKAPEPAKAPEVPRAAEPKAEPRPVTPPAAAPTTLASAAPTAPAGPPRIVSRVDPEFPREAVKAGADSGSVRARMTLDASGAVTRVEIVEASPRRVFDRAVVQALTQWRFNEGAAGRTVETEVAFRR